MKSDDPFKHLGLKGGQFSRKDPLEYKDWNSKKLFMVVTFLNIPLVALSICLFFMGLEILSILLLAVVVMFLAIGCLANFKYIR